MKLKNKKTGEIIDIKDALRDSDDYPNHYLISAEWEDVPEEPKKGWYLSSLGGPIAIVFGDDSFSQTLEAIGNYFETKEEAEKAVEKLKAWKRLKDEGFKFTDWYRDVCEVSIQAEIHDEGALGMINDLDLLFSGGEE